MIYEKLTRIQNELKAPKSRYNSFGKYNYRSLEDILEGVKPLLAKEKVSLFLEDSVVQIGERYYIKATAYLYDFEDKSVITTSALAREEEEKKGMDGSQISGACSSYARKYCLSSLLLIDDTKDADTDEYKNESDGRAKAETKKAEFKANAEAEGLESAKKKLVATCKAMNIDPSSLLKKTGWEEGQQATLDQVSKATQMLKNISDERAKNGKS